MSKFTVGQLVYRWYNQGGDDYIPIYGHIVRINLKSITVTWERNRTWRVRPDDIYPETNERLIAEIERDYFKCQELKGNL